MTPRTLLQRLLEPGGLQSLFQPIYAVGSGAPKLQALEALTRGPEGSNGAKADVLFEYVRLKKAEAAVDRACLAAALQTGGHLARGARLALNLHASTLARDRAFPRFLGDLCARLAVDPRRLTCEILEQGPALDSAGFQVALGELRELGVRIALDDLGVGASNLRMLLEVKPDYVKLDRFFVTGAAADRSRAAVLEAMSLLARRLGSDVVAEGVEGPAELDTVTGYGIKLVQGNLFCPAVTVAELCRREPQLLTRHYAA
jgi:EAL domain-containing protein (putative c-di-GMP-specific phosphodiesterase class I)